MEKRTGVACTGLLVEVEIVNTESFPSVIAPGDTVTLIHGRGDGLGDAAVRGIPATADNGIAAEMIVKAKTTEALTTARSWPWRCREDVDWEVKRYGGFNRYGIYNQHSLCLRPAV